MADHYRGHRAGSRKATVRREYDEKGAEAAIAKGAELGLAGGTVKSWIGGWKKSAPPDPNKPSKYPPVRLDKVISTERRAIILKGHPESKGIVIETGSQQSIVKWANGNQVVVSNDWIEDDK